MAKRMLILYYSQACGNTRMVAERLQAKTGADIEQIDTTIPYTGTYSEIVDLGKFEVDTKFEPAIKKLDHNVADYDVIAIGTPTWWYEPAPAIMRLIHKNNWQGKIVVPFMTNGGWPGRVIRAIKTECVGASFGESIEVQFDSDGGSRLITNRKDIDEWAERIAETLNK